MVSKSRVAPSRRTTQAHVRSPNRASGRPITAARSTSGKATSSSSISRGVMLMPPRMMISFLRPVIDRYPSSSSEPRSPVRNQPSLKDSAVASLFCQ